MTCADVHSHPKEKHPWCGSTVNAGTWDLYLKWLIKDTKRKVFLILNNLRAHHLKLVKAWQAKHEDEIEVFYLPSYIPELNPDEMLNADLN